MSKARYAEFSKKAWTEPINEEQRPGPDSRPQRGVPKGAVHERVWRDSRIFPGATHEYWLYVPAQYDASRPACVAVFQDGWGYADPEGSMRAPTVFDNLIHKGDMPVTIGVFVNPGKKEQVYDQRAVQYVPLDDKYARFLLEEILPQAGKEHNLAEEAAGRAICGMSDGGLCAFTVAWERPDAFSKVISHVGSFTRHRGGSEYPYLIRKTRGDPKPIRVFLQDGMNDLNLAEGNWALANMEMASALMFARYDYRFEMGSGGHDLRHGGALFPETMRWIWRDHPGVRNAGAASSLDALEAVVGRWQVETNVHGEPHRAVLTIAAPNGELTATLRTEKDGDVPVSAVRFKDGILRYEYPPPPSQRYWGKGEIAAMETWLKVRGDTFEGALSSATDFKADYATKGARG